jgi:hypothetical protein
MRHITFQCISVCLKTCSHVWYVSGVTDLCQWDQLAHYKAIHAPAGARRVLAEEWWVQRRFLALQKETPNVEYSVLQTEETLVIQDSMNSASVA